MLVGVNDRQMVQASAFESVWPVGGGTLVHDGAVYAAAGRHSQFDGGIQVVRLDPSTGRTRWRSQVSSIRNYNNSVMNEPLLIRQGRLWLSRVSLELADGTVIDPRSPKPVTFADGSGKTTRDPSGRIPQVPSDDWPSTTGNNAWGRDFPGVYGQGYHMMRDRQAVVTRDGACTHFTFVREGDWFASVGRGGAGAKGGGPPAMTSLYWFPPGAVPYGTKAAPTSAWEVEDTGTVAGIASNSEVIAVLADRKGRLGWSVYGRADGRPRTDFAPLGGGQPVWRGLAVAGGALYVAMRDGSLVSYR